MKAAITLVRAQQQVIANPQCPACGIRADGVLDRSLSNDGYFICPNLNCENEWIPNLISKRRA